VLAATKRPTIYDQSLQVWWQAAYKKGQGEIYISQPILDPSTQTRSLIIVIPLYSTQKRDLVGMLKSNYKLENMAYILEVNHPGEIIENNLLLPTGQMLTSSNQFLFIDQDLLDHIQSTATTQFAMMDFEGKTQLVSQALVVAPNSDETSAFNGLNWIVIAHQESANAYAPINAAWRTTLISTLAVLLLASGLALVLAQVLVAPISRLTAVAQKIEAGNLSTRAQVESRDEIGILASTFNKMLDTLVQSQEDLQESEALNYGLVENSPDMIAVFNSEGKTLFINPAGVKLLGARSANELIGQPALGMTSSEYEEMTKWGMDETLAIGDLTTFTHQKMRRLDGRSFDAEFKAIPISYAGQSATQFIMRDISIRKTAEELIRQMLSDRELQKQQLESRVAQRTEELKALTLRLQEELSERQRLVQSLQESEQRFHLIFDTSPDAIFLVDPLDSTVIWRIVDCNPVACQMNGYSREELIGQSIDLVNDIKETEQGFNQTYERLKHERNLQWLETSHRHKDGHTFTVEYSNSLINIGEHELVLGIDRDITERKQIELDLQTAKNAADNSRLEAETANRAKSEFVSRMSHELRTPMNAILGFAQLLSMSSKDPLTSTQKERMKQIETGGQHLLSLINEILDISRVEAGRIQISPEPVSIRESIQEATDLTLPLTKTNHIVLQNNLKVDSNPFVVADRQRLKQVLLNLLSNAVKYNRNGGLVTITCDATQSKNWRISITDTGQGISPQDLDYLFIPFERLSADKSSVEGTGLGLALAKRLVELMEGQIGVESVQGQGSTFWVELPSTESQSNRLNRNNVTGNLPFISGNDRKILYIEDNIANFELIQQVLADYGQIELLWGKEAENGLELAHKHQPDLILLDLHIGGTDGRRVLRMLKEDKQTTSIPIVIVSADATPGQIKRLLALGAHSYLTKPLDIKLFIQLIEKLLNEKGG
jgi:PAS domain S-box-containing protein